MRIESKLCHISENKAVVQVNGWIDDKYLGSAMAEGVTVETAEDKAILRLNNRINAETNNAKSPKSSNDDNIKTKMKVEIPRSDIFEGKNTQNEPSDWSSELTAIDSEIERLKWSRDDEINFLKKTLGYNNRNKITNYNDILKYLSLLKNKDIHIISNGNDGDINNLIKESDQILRDLSWDRAQGREYLQKEFNVSTRRQLNKNQLKLFIQNLKSFLKE